MELEFLPFDYMWTRTDISFQNSDLAYALDLLLFGELVTKFTTLGLIAGLEDSPKRHSYRFLYNLVRADGIGDWSRIIDDVLTGPAAENLCENAREEQNQLTQKKSKGTWQYDAVELLNDCLRNVGAPTETQSKVDGRLWFQIFARLRNKTKGHGAQLGGEFATICIPLKQSIELMTKNLKLFQRPWAYLYRNLSGKYRVTKWTPAANSLDVLKTDEGKEYRQLEEGVYICYENNFTISDVNLSRINLVVSDIDAKDFFLPNGGFDDKKYELVSYNTGTLSEAPSAPYLMPSTMLPNSETQGLGQLDVQGLCFGNLPAAPSGYVSRHELENELYEKLINDRHPIITLMGRGGIGKTWLTLHLLHRISQLHRFEIILWFSARDIDLLMDGPKQVAPHVTTEVEIAKEFVALIGPHEKGKDKKFNPVNYFAEQLTHSSNGSILFVFDNFETVRSPALLYNWIDTYIRLPNKALITTRYRDFKGDYPVEVLGMHRAEYQELVKTTARSLSVEKLLKPSDVDMLYTESSGHPYVTKIMLGEVARVGAVTTDAKRIVANRDDILDALFERTYSRLSSAAVRVFLTLCSWRSTIPQVVLEAVLLRNENIDVEKGIEELRMASFIEIAGAADSTLFISVPLVAHVFGQRKLAVSEYKIAVEADRPLLQLVGATQPTDVAHGLLPRINRITRTIADKISRSGEALSSYIPMLEFIARRFTPTWLLIASLYEESIQEINSDGSSNLAFATEAVKHFLEIESDTEEAIHAWERLAAIYRRMENFSGEVQALAALSENQAATYNQISESVNRLNFLFSQRRLTIDQDEKRILFEKLLEIMEARLDEANATDCSRLAWLCIHLQFFDKAAKYTQLGLSKDANNLYCVRLAEQSSIG